NGLRVQRGASFPTDVGDEEAGGTENEISDFEAQLYDGYVNGVRVQSYWSARDGSFVVPDAAGGRAAGLGVSGGVLRVSGDQFGASYNEAITLATGAHGGVSVSLNGEPAEFSAGAISSVVVSAFGGTNTLQVLGVPEDTAVTVYGSGL